MAVTLPVIDKVEPLNVKLFSDWIALVPLPVKRALEVKVEAPVPPLATDKSVPLQLLLFILTEPPKDKFPEVVTVPLKVIPLTVPVPPTEVTVPVNSSLPVSTNMLKVEASPFVKVIVFKDTEDVVINDPVSTVPPPPLPLTVVNTTLPSSSIDNAFTLSSSGTESKKTSETNTFCPVPSVLTENFLFSAIFYLSKFT